MKTWSKTILSVYKYLEALSNSIDDLVRKKSINSAFYNNGRFDSAYSCANKIMRLTNRKVNLINLKVLVENTLLKLPLKYRQVLILNYVDGVKSCDIAETMHISNRTYFRVKSESLERFADALINEGFTKEKLEEMFCDENWLTKLYNQNMREIKTDFNDDVLRYRFFKSVIREFNMVY